MKQRFWLFTERSMWLDSHYEWFLSLQRKFIYPKDCPFVLISLTQKYTRQLGPHLVMRAYAIDYNHNDDEVSA